MKLRQLVVVVGLMVPAAAVAQPVDSGGDQRAPKAGLGILDELGCVGCHTTDGTRKVGPTLLGYFGSEVTVTGPGGVRRPVTADAAHVRRSLREPNVELQDGYPANTMPLYDLTGAQVESLVAALQLLGTADTVRARARAEGSLLPLSLALVLFIAGHLVMSSIPVRTPLVRRFGANGFMVAYSVFAAATLGWIAYAFSEAPYVPLWTPQLWTRWVPVVSMPIIFSLLAGAFTIKNPTMAGGEHMLDNAEPAVGMARITRHPMLVSTVLWGMCHVPPNGDLAAVMLFGGMSLLSILGMVHIDRRRSLAEPAKWERFAGCSSRIPFWAIARGRNRLVIRELYLPVLLGVIAFVATLFTHTYTMGESPLPY